MFSPYCYSMLFYIIFLCVDLAGVPGKSTENRPSGELYSYEYFQQESKNLVPH